MAPEERVQREELLLRAVLGGDERSWQVWYEETFEDLYAYIVWRCHGRRDRADEIAQETWLVAVRHVRRFDPHRGSFLDWLRGVAANVLRNHLRQERRRLGREHAVARGNASDLRDERWDQSYRVAAALDALPERQEAVLRAKYLDGLSVDEIATMWNESVKAVESLLSRARQGFRHLYEKQVDADREAHQDGVAEVTSPFWHE